MRQFRRAAAAGCRSCRPTGSGSTPTGQPESEPTRPSLARSSSTCMASRMAPSIRRSRSVGVISPRSACSRKIAQTCWSAASTVSTVITVPTSHLRHTAADAGPGQGLWSSLWAALLPHEAHPEPELRLRSRRASRPNGTSIAHSRRLRGNGLNTRDQREPLTWWFVVERMTGIEQARMAGSALIHPDDQGRTPRGDGDGTGDRGHGRLSTQRELRWPGDRDGSTRSTRGPVLMPPQRRQAFALDMTAAR